MAGRGESGRRGRRSLGRRLDSFLLRIYGPAEIGADTPPTDEQWLVDDVRRREHAASWDVETDSSGRRYVVARPGGLEDPRTWRQDPDADDPDADDPDAVEAPAAGPYGGTAAVQPPAPDAGESADHYAVGEQDDRNTPGAPPR